MENWIVIFLISLSFIFFLTILTFLTTHCCVYKDNKESRNVKDEVIIVTGGTSGIGEIMWKDFYRKEAKVIITGRNYKKVKHTINNFANYLRKIKEENLVKKLVEGKWDDKNNFYSENLIYYKLDQSSLKECKEFCLWFIEKFDKLNILFLNAGLWVTEERKTKEGLEFTMGVNHYSHFYMTSELFSLLKSTPNSRVLSTSSIVSQRLIGSPNPIIDLDDIDWKNSKKWKKYNGAHRYANSKFANVIFSKALARFFEDEKVEAKAASYRPGVTATGFQSNVNECFFSCVLSCFRCYFKSQIKGTQTSLYLAYMNYRKLVNGEFYDNCAVGKINPDAKVEKYWMKFWNISMDIVKEVGFPAVNFRKFEIDDELI